MVRQSLGPELLRVPFLLYASIHRSAQKVNSPKLDFRYSEFYEVGLSSSQLESWVDLPVLSLDKGGEAGEYSRTPLGYVPHRHAKVVR